MLWQSMISKSAKSSAHRIETKDSRWPSRWQNNRTQTFSCSKKLRVAHNLNQSYENYYENLFLRQYLDMILVCGHLYFQINQIMWLVYAWLGGQADIDWLQRMDTNEEWLVCFQKSGMKVIVGPLASPMSTCLHDPATSLVD
mmetsp:Transcript_24837/g.71239  ORF Transcript_24837/g.71239 Transcript_24837/m.71239 type:complete len:142 (+) Transcript_24837:437-862(+)